MIHSNDVLPSSDHLSFDEWLDSLEDCMAQESTLEEGFRVITEDDLELVEVEHKIFTNFMILEYSTAKCVITKGNTVKTYSRGDRPLGIRITGLNVKERFFLYVLKIKG